MTSFFKLISDIKMIQGKMCFIYYYETGQKNLQFIFLLTNNMSDRVLHKEYMYTVYI